MFISVFTRTRHMSLLWARSIPSTPRDLTSVRLFLNCPTIYNYIFQVMYFFQVFLLILVINFFFFPWCYMSHSYHPPWFDNPAFIWHGVQITKLPSNPECCCSDRVPREVPGTSATKKQQCCPIDRCARWCEFAERTSGKGIVRLTLEQTGHWTDSPPPPPSNHTNRDATESCSVYFTTVPLNSGYFRFLGPLWTGFEDRTCTISNQFWLPYVGQRQYKPSQMALCRIRSSGNWFSLFYDEQNSVRVDSNCYMSDGVENKPIQILLCRTQSNANRF
jgi:hypothetical protein